MQYELENSVHFRNEKEKNLILQQAQNEIAHQQTFTIGMRTKPRCFEPSMYDNKKELLQQESSLSDNNKQKSAHSVNSWDFKSKKLYKTTGSPAKNYINKISRQNWQSEAQDQYRTFKKEGNIQQFQQFDQDTLQNLDQHNFFHPKNDQVLVGDSQVPFNSQDLYQEYMTQNTSEYNQQYAQLQKPKTIKQLRETVMINQLDNNDFQLKKIHQQPQHPCAYNLIEQNQANMESSAQWKDKNYNQLQDEEDENDRQLIEDSENENRLQEKINYERENVAQNKSSQKRREDQEKKFDYESRQLPNSAFTTYYGKPPFENYGNQNTSDKTDGFLYKNYMKSHSVNPHRNTTISTKNEFRQTMEGALLQCETKDLEIVKPEVPRLQNSQKRQYQNYLQLQNNSEKKSLKEIQKEIQNMREDKEKKNKNKLIRQEKNKHLLKEKRGMQQIEKLNFSRSEKDIYKPISEQKKLVQEQMLIQNLKNLQFEGDYEDNSLVVNSIPLLPSQPYIINVLPENEQKAVYTAVFEKNNNSNSNNNIQMSSGFGSSLQIPQQQLLSSSKQEKSRINSQQNLENKNQNSVNMSYSRIQGTTNNQFSFKKSNKSMNIREKAKQQISFKLQADKPEKKLNKFQEVLSRYNSVPSTMEEDKRILEKLKKMRHDELKEKWESDNDQDNNPCNVWISKIPPAGKRKERNDFVQNILYHHHQCR